MSSNIENPLVSVTVITYNSSSYVLETLESIKAQTYQTIELIVSDDCSTDNTVEICSEWIKQNKERFVDAYLITSPVNTGIAPNKNRALAKCHGEWVKGIAGDDALMPDIIEKYINYIEKNQSIRIIHSNVKKYNNYFKEEFFIDNPNLKTLKINLNSTNAEEQFQILLRSGPIQAATAMIKMDVYKEVGFYDEQSPFWEDNPMWLKITKNGIKLHFINVIGAKYRIHNDSVQGGNKQLFSKYKLSRDKYYKIKYLNELPILERRLNAFIINRNILFAKIFNNKRNLFTLILLLTIGYVPTKIISKLKSKYL